MTKYDQKKLLDYIDAVSFAMIDTSMYLDTHPDDREAIAHFQKYQSARKKALKEYSQYFEPLTMDTAEVTDTFTWATTKWPWMKEGC
jgi:spore coat protein JB